MSVFAFHYEYVIIPLLTSIFLFLGWQLTGETVKQPGEESAQMSEKLLLLPVGAGLAAGFLSANFLPFTGIGMLAAGVIDAAVWFFISTLRKKSIPCAVSTALLSLIPAAAVCPLRSLFRGGTPAFYMPVVLLVVLALLISMYFGSVSLCREPHWLHLAWEKEKKDIMVLLIAALAVSCLFAVILSNASFENLGLRITASILILLLYPLTFFILTLWTHMRSLKRKEETMERWMIESRDYMNVIRSQRHDYNLHVHTLAGLLNSEAYGKAREYMQRMADEASDINEIMPVNDAALGSLLYNLRLEARKKGSDIHFKITYDMKDTICSSFSCNKIIGNLLQNAIDAINTPEDIAYGIHMRILKRRGNTVITVENRYTGDRETILKAFEAGFTTKKYHEGIGLAMVQRTVTREGGRIYPEMEPEILRFVVTLPNRITLEKEDETV